MFIFSHRFQLAPLRAMPNACGNNAPTLCANPIFVLVDLSLAVQILLAELALVTLMFRINVTFPRLFAYSVDVYVTV